MSEEACDDRLVDLTLRAGRLLTGVATLPRIAARLLVDEFRRLDDEDLLGDLEDTELPALVVGIGEILRAEEREET